MDYVPHSEADISSILKEMNIGDIEDLYSSVPEKIKIKSRRLERGLSEFELKALIRKKAEKNLAVTEIKSFIGGGAFEHFIPAVVDHIAMKPEFYTAYTPYQPEASQGALQVIYEYQSLICELTGMDASNASLYDGATAAAEAALMSINKDGPGDVLISAAVNPEYVEVIKTYLKGTKGRILMVPSPEGVTSVEEVIKRTILTKESLPAYLVNPDMEKYDDGDVVIREGNTDNDFFELLQGAVIVVKGGKKIAEITQPGAYFGEMSAISGEARSASIISKGRATVRRFPGDKLFEVIESYPEVTKHLFKTMVSRLEHSNEIIMKLANGRKAR